MAARALTADPVEPAPGNGGEGQKVTCAGGSQAILEEDLVRWLQQRKGARMRRQAVLTKVLKRLEWQKTAALVGLVG